MKNNEIETTLVHEFLLCKQEFHAFYYYAAILKIKPDEKKYRIEAFTRYGNFLRHLYSFYEGQIKHKNKELIKGIPDNKLGEKISEIISNEVIKIIKRNQLIYSNNLALNKREIECFNDSEISIDFGNNLRYIRNRFSHISAKRVNKEDMTLSEFYNKYHKYVMLLFETAAFTWDMNENSIEEYDWLEIDNFMK